MSRVVDLTKITRADVGNLLDRLAAAYQHRIPKGWEAQTVDVYHAEVKMFDTAIVERAVAELISNPGRGFPNAGTLRGMCFKMLRARESDLARQSAPPEGACAGCRVTPYVAGYERPNGEIILRVRCKCPQAGRGWDTPAALAATAAAQRERPTTAREMPRVTPSTFERGDAWEG